MRGFAIAVVLLPLSVLASDQPASAYTGGPVANGGAITGVVTFAGSKPKAAPLKVTKDHGTCGHSKPSEALLVGPAKGLANTVVYLEKIEAGKPAPAQLVHLNQKGCVYEPHVQAAVRGSKIELRSSDPVLHNVHGALDGKRLLFNVAMPMKDQTITKKLKKSGLLEITCDAGHTWMKAFVRVLDHPYFAVTGADGQFRIGDVPPGTYTLVVWHETLGTKKTKVIVSAGADAKAKLTYD